jgi:Fe-S-cluster containining protein
MFDVHFSNMTANDKIPVNTCKQCGTCCKKGGPSFHLKDRRLIDEGLIPGRDLFTIRKGEPALENVQDRLISTNTDIIKIKGKPGSWECVYHNRRPRGCGIYENRPEECRVLTCWDTGPIEALYTAPHLTRRDLLFGVQGVWELIEDHQHRCDYETILNLQERIKTHSDKAAKGRIWEMVAYDRQIRRTLIENSVAPDMMDFLFGRPLTVTLPVLGIQV